MASSGASGNNDATSSTSATLKASAEAKRKQLIERSNSRAEETKRRMASITQYNDLAQKRMSHLATTTAGPLLGLAAGGGGGSAGVGSIASNPLLSGSTSSIPPPVHPLESGIHKTLTDFEALRNHQYAKQTEMEANMKRLNDLLEEQRKEAAGWQAQSKATHDQAAQTKHGDKKNPFFPSTPGQKPFSTGNIEEMNKLHQDKFAQLQGMANMLKDLNLGGVLQQGHASLDKATKAQQDLFALQKRMRDEERRGSPGLLNDPLLNLLGKSAIERVKTTLNHADLNRNGITILRVDTAIDSPANTTPNASFRMEWRDMCFVTTTSVALVGIAVDPESNSQFGIVGLLDLKKSTFVWSFPAINPPSSDAIKDSSKVLMTYLAGTGLVPIIPILPQQTEKGLLHYVPKQILATADGSQLLIYGTAYPQAGESANATVTILNAANGTLVRTFGLQMDKSEKMTPDVKTEAVRMATIPNSTDLFLLVHNNPLSLGVRSILARVTAAGERLRSVNVLESQNGAKDILATDLCVDHRGPMLHVIGLEISNDGTRTGLHGYFSPDSLEPMPAPEGNGKNGWSRGRLSIAARPSTVDIHAKIVVNSDEKIADPGSSSPWVIPSTWNSIPPSPQSVVEVDPPIAKIKPSGLQEIKDRLEAKQAHMTNLSVLLQKHDRVEYARVRAASSSGAVEKAQEPQISKELLYSVTDIPLRFVNGEFNNIWTVPTVPVHGTLQPVAATAYQEQTFVCGSNSETTAMLWKSLGDHTRSRGCFSLGGPQTCNRPELQCLTAGIPHPLQAKRYLACGWWQPHPWLSARAAVILCIDRQNEDF